MDTGNSERVVLFCIVGNISRYKLLPGTIGTYNFPARLFSFSGTLFGRLCGVRASPLLCTSAYDSCARVLMCSAPKCTEHQGRSSGSGIEIPAVENPRLPGPPFTPRPRAQQRWVHSCCSQEKLTRALSDPDVTAIEADIMVATEAVALLLRPNDSPGVLPIMAHPTLLGHLSGRNTAPAVSDLTFSDFLDRCIADGTRHLKLDFKQLAAVEPCLELIADRWPQLHANGQAVWLNADVLPGPNRRDPPELPASVFVPLCVRHCPHAVLSLGWCVGALGPEVGYAEQDVQQMLKVCKEHRLSGGSLVFAASIRFAARDLSLMGRLLEQVPDAQLLFWTGTGELPVQPAVQTRAHLVMAARGLTERVGYDVAIATSSCQNCAAHAIDCTFVWSRWTRWLCCASQGLEGLSREALKHSTADANAGERQRLVDQSPGGTRTASMAPTPERMPSLSE